MRSLYRWSGKWWPGVIPLVVLWAFAAWNATLPMEADIAARSNAALKDNVLDKTNIEAAGRDITFQAEAFSQDGRRSAVAAVEAVAGVRLVNDGTSLVPEARPFAWWAERDVVRVTLGGNAPLPAIKARLAESARAALAGVEVADRMVLARGAPPRFDAAASLLIEQIAKLKDGKITLSDSQVTLSGMAREIGGREAIASALRNLPDGYTIAKNELQAPPYVFQAIKDPVAATLTLSGYAPDNTAHLAIVDASRRKFFNEKVVDNLKNSAGAPGGFSDAVIAGLSGLSRLSTGTLQVNDREVKLSGDALYEDAARVIRGDLARALPQGFQSKPEVSVKPPASPVEFSLWVAEGLKPCPMP